MHRTLVEVYDASFNLVEVTAGVLDEDADWVYKNGQCLALAVALAEQTGWPVILKTHEDGEEGETYQNLRHAFVQAPDGSLLDIQGSNDAEIVAEMDADIYGWEQNPQTRLVPAGEARSLLVEFEKYLVDQDLDVARSFVPAVLACAGHPVEA